MILVPFELSINGKRTMWLNIHKGVPKTNQRDPDCDSGCRC